MLLLHYMERKKISLKFFLLYILAIQSSETTLLLPHIPPKTLVKKRTSIIMHFRDKTRKCIQSRWGGLSLLLSGFDHWGQVTPLHFLRREKNCIIIIIISYLENGQRKSSGREEIYNVYTKEELSA